MRTIYLAGPILDAKDPKSWRYDMKRLLREVGLQAIDPFDQAVYDDPEHPAHTDASITARDLYHASRCDLLLVNFLGCERVSIGTVMEIAWAYQNHIPIVLVTDWKEGSRHHHDHCMVRGCASFIVDTLGDAMEMISITLGEYVT